MVELYAGLAAVTLHLCGCKPPVSRIGSKAGYAAAIVQTLGVEDPGQFLLVDTDPSVVQVLRSLVSPEGRQAIAALFVKWPESREKWEALRKERFIGHREAARWLYVTAASRGGIGGFKGKHKLRPSVRGFIPTLASLRSRVISLKLDERRFDIRCCKAEDIEPVRGATVYLDPPYADCQSYAGGGAAGSAALAVFQRWSSAGCRVALSERRSSLDLDAERIDLTTARRAQFRRSMTRSSQEFLWVSR